jgi:hypothetical protein
MCASLAVGSKLPNRGSGYPLQSFGGNGRRGAPATAKSISASIPSATMGDRSFAATVASEAGAQAHQTERKALTIGGKAARDNFPPIPSAAQRLKK